MPYCDNKKVIFLHVPKTGGTTIGNIFDIRQFQDSNPEKVPTPQHFTCSMLRERLGDKKYNAYYKFTFVRNPWSRILSSYFWRQQLPKKRLVLPFIDFVKNARRLVYHRQYYTQEFGDHFIPQVEYTLDVDDVFRFEDFASSINAIASKLGLSNKDVLKKTPKHYDKYWEFYDRDSRSIIAEIYQDEIEKFSFNFGDHNAIPP